MKKWIVTLAVLSLVLAGCGANKDGGTGGAAGHEGHGQHQETPAAGQKDEHAGHGGEAKTELSTKAVWKLNPAQPQAGQDTSVSIQIQDDKGQPVEKFDLNHEKQLHLIAVSKDLSYFDHIHPEYKGKGVFEITTKLPAGGAYKLFADYVPTGSTATTKSEWIQVGGGAPAAKAPEPESKLTKVVDGKEISLQIDGLAAGKEVMLTYHLSDAATKKPIENLEPYLGAVGHVVILDEAAEQYLHVHPMDEKAKGPEAQFMTTFPKSGIYKIWGQFQQGGKTFIVPFVVKVP
ncbi:hypothetical protein J2T17_000823 [Paenibacillus mucilaginosus]|uniref:hypothetical protein n=1 Tax=Paenibacillus mucilaginosus TaxID=61624 RepID=UPI003D1FB4A6